MKKKGGDGDLLRPLKEVTHYEEGSIGLKGGRGCERKVVCSHKYIIAYPCLIIEEKGGDE